MKQLQENRLYRMISPRSLAFFGASNNMMNMGTMIMARVKDLGYRGEIYPIHPKEETVLGHKAYPTIADTPEAPDLAVMILPSKVIPEVMEQCGQRGVKNLVVVSGGFEEVGEEGAAMQKHMADIADQYGIRFMGPNCLGVCNTHIGLNTTPLPYDGKPGFIGLATQSGSFMTQIYDFLARHEIGFSTAMSVGNEANVDIVDCLELLGSDPDTKVIGMYIESIRRGREFVEVARQITPHKPIVAFYVGGSETGRRAALSHTGALAGPDKLYDGIFAQSGIVRAQTITEMFDICWALGSLPLPQGDGMAIQTDSGGPGAAGADATERAGLRVPPLSEATKELLKPLIPPTASANNPVDITFPREFRNYYHDLPDILLRDEDISGLLVYFILPVELMVPTFMDKGMTADEAYQEAVRTTAGLYTTTHELVAKHGKPIMGYSFNSLEKEPITSLLRAGMPVFPTPQRAARAMAGMVRYAKLRKKLLAQVELAA